MRILILFLLLFAAGISRAENEPPMMKPLPVQQLYRLFQQPPAEARPFVRWWWSNNQIQLEQVNRELDAFKAAGIGGVEINPILDPARAWERKTLSSAPILTWLSPEWNQLLLETGKSVEERGMIMDLLGGSGWPFGGDFLAPEDTAYRMVVHHDRVSGPNSHQADLNEVFKRKPPYMRSGYKKARNAQEELKFLALLPINLEDPTRIQLLPLPSPDESGMIQVDIPEGEFLLSYGVIEQNFRYVGNAVDGANGPALNHFSEQATRNYFAHLFGIQKDWDVPLSKYIRAIFSDSIELTESNYSPGMLEDFQKSMGYDLRPFLALVLLPEAEATKLIPHSNDLKNKLRRIRFDWSSFQVQRFLTQFTQTYIDLCEERGLLARYQSGGNPSWMGIAEGAMLPHIPEAENWPYRKEYLGHDAFYERTWTTQKSNIKYTASAANLSNRRIASAEAMTNVVSLFQMTLAQMKQALDVNFIGGLNHTVLHGATYSPPDVPFPGLIRFGTLVTSHNSWWPYFKQFADYNARLSAVFQHSRMHSEVAILTPGSDVWGIHGLEKYKLVNQPKYLGSLWKSLAELGISSDYLHQQVLEQAQVGNGTLNYGPMRYRALIVAEVQSLSPKAAETLLAFRKAGGELLFVGRSPSRTPGYRQAEEGDRRVQTAIQAARKAGARQLPPPEFTGDLPALRSWVSQAITTMDFNPALRIISPREGAYALHRKAADADLLFFSNTHRFQEFRSSVEFELGQRGLWKWDPENGSSEFYKGPQHEQGFDIQLAPLESLLLISGPRRPASAEEPDKQVEILSLDGPWQLRFHPMDDGEIFELPMAKLQEFREHPDKRVSRFSGTVRYQTRFELTGGGRYLLHLGDQNDQICEVVVNGSPVGVSWYGQGSFDITAFLKAEDNLLEIRYTNTLFNGLIGSETFNRFWNRWHKNQEPELQPNGLLGPVEIRRFY